MHKLGHLFAAAGYTWKFSDGERIPTEDEIQKTIDAAIVLLADEPENAQIEVGRLIVKKREGFVDVFVHAQEKRVA